MAKIRQLLEQYTAVLTRDGGNFAIGGATAIVAVTRGAGLEQHGAMLEVGLELGSIDEFLVARVARIRRLRLRARDQAEQRETTEQRK